LNSRQSKRFLLTGGTGFIGAHLVRRLLFDGHQVFLLSLESADRSRLTEVEDHIQILPGDVTDASAVRKIVKQVKPDIVYHMASTPFNPPTISAQTHMQVIVVGTLNLLDALVDCQGVRVIYTSSVAEYGGGSELRENSPLLPGTLLGAAKAGASLLMQTYARLYQMETVVLRLFTPYGPWEGSGRLIPYTVLSALDGQDIRISSGKQQRDYVYVADVIEALLLAAERPISAGSALNICSGQGIPIREVVDQTLRLMGNPVKLLAGALPTRPDEIWECSGDNAAARSVLGWEPRTNLQDGLRKSIAWFTENRELARRLP
jgi:nucleoside-diphosphate-sugar epimerase